MSDPTYGRQHPIGCRCKHCEFSPRLHQGDATACPGVPALPPETVDTQARRDIAALLARVEALEAARAYGDGQPNFEADLCCEQYAMKALADRDAWKARAESAEAFSAKLEGERDRMRDALMSVAAEELKAGKWAMGCACSDRLPYIYSVVRKALAALEAK